MFAGQSLARHVAPNAPASLASKTRNQLNFLTQDEGERIAQAYGGNYDRLAAVKKRYDPANLFRQNQSIKPA